ncbi:MAG: fibronectin type III domain-containing protein, partial [Limisphaerales bacterium]
YVVTYNGATATVKVNQQTGGGAWNLLGKFNFTTGTGGNVKITDAVGNSTLLAIADAMKFSYVQPVNPPAAPNGLTATAVSPSQINLAWTDNSNNENNFIVSRSATSGGPYTDIATLAANTASYSNTGLAASTTYYYVVRASNAGGSSAFSAQASATTQAPPPPAAPSGLTATAASSTSINLSWTDNSNNENNFIVARSLTSGGPYTDVATLAANTTAYTGTGLNGSTTYYYVVRASNGSGSSANSAQASATTQPVADIIIDNTGATFVGTWSTGTIATDKYGTDYRYHGSGTGANTATYSPNILVAGNYQVYAWYPQGSNRPTAAPYLIHYNGGTGSATLNQTINGGTWNSLGTYNFAVGTTGNAQVTDNFSGTPVVMADAIKFVYVP